MSAKVVVPDRIISSAASWVPVRTKAGVTTLASAGKMYCWSQSIRLRSLPRPRNSTIGAWPWVLISPGRTIWPVPSMVWRGWKAAAMAAGVSTPTMSAPSIATAPGASTRRVAVDGDDGGVGDDQRDLALRGRLRRPPTVARQPRRGSAGR